MLELGRLLEDGCVLEDGRVVEVGCLLEDERVLDTRCLLLAGCALVVGFLL